jgi:ribonuclease HI
MSFLFEAGVFNDRCILGGSLRGEVTEIEWNKFTSFYLKPGKAPGPSKVPNELIKTASSIETRILRAWANKILTAEQLTPDILCEEDVHGVISLLHKGGGTTIHPSDWRPVVLMDGMNQLMGYIILERLTRLTEGSNVLEASQGGYREGRGGDLNMHKIDYLARQAREQHRVLLRADIDFANAFNSVSHGALWAVLEGFRVPDVDWLKQLYAKLTVRLKGEADVGSSMVLNTGVAQGHVLSPFLFILFVNALSRYLTAVGSKHGIEHGIRGVRGWNHTLFCDDLTLFAQTEAGMQTLLEAVSVFEDWSGLPVKLKKCCVMRVGGQHSEECKNPQIKYRGWTLRVVDDDEEVRHLGFWTTPNGDWKGMVDRVHVSTLEAINIVKHSAKVVSPSAGVTLFNSLAVSVFRYSAALIPWGRHDLGVDTLPAQLDKIGHLWCQGFSSAWDLPAGTAHDLFTFPSEQGGMGYLQPVEVMTEAILQHIHKGLLHDDVMRDIIMLELQQAKEDWLCTTWDDLLDEASLRPWNQAAHNMWLRLAKGLQFCNTRMSFSPVLEDLQGSGELSWAKATRHLRQVTQRLREVDGGEPVWATWNHGNHGEEVVEEERSNFLTVSNWRTLCQGEKILWKYKQVLGGMELRDVRKLSREKMEGQHKIPWLLCKRTPSADQNENPSVVGKGRKQEVRVCLPRTMGISLGDSTALQKYLDLVDWSSLDVFPAEFKQQENMKWHTTCGARGLKQKQPGVPQGYSNEVLDTPEADIQRSLRDWYVQVQADARTLKKATCDPTKCECCTLKRFAGPETSAMGWCPRSLAHTISADPDSFLRGQALWLNEGIETGRWGNGAEEAPYSSDSENMTLSEMVSSSSNRETVEPKGQMRHAHLDMDGMEIDTTPETPTADGEIDRDITCEVPRPIDPITAVMGILWRIEGILTEADTRMRDGNEVSWWQLTGAKSSLATLKQARQVLLTRIKRCSSGHRLSMLCRRCTAPGCWHCHVGREEIQCWMCHDRVNQATSTVPERRILEDALSCNLHKLGASLIEKVVDVRPHPEPISQATQDRIQFKAHIKGWQGVAERRKWTGPLVKCRKGELTDVVWRVRDKCILLFPCEWEKEEWNGPPVEIGAPDTVYLGWRKSTSSWCRCRVIRQVGAQHVETCRGECTKQCERIWEVREVEEGAEVLELRERQLRNVPEELGWWYRVDSKTMGRFCNRCACWLPREEWDLRNWKAPVDTETKVASCMNCSERNQCCQWPIRKCTERHSEVLGIRPADPRFAGEDTGAHGPLYLDGDLLQKYIKHAHSRTEQEVYTWMTTSEMGFPVTKEREEVQCWRDIVEDRTVARFLAPVITAYIRGLQGEGAGGECARMLLSDLEELDREWSQDDRQSAGNCRGRKRCLTGVSFTPHAADLSMSEQHEGKKSRQGQWEQTSVSRWKDSPDPLPDTDVVMHTGRVDKFETVLPGRGFVRVISDSIRTVEQYGGVSIEIGEGLATCTTLDYAWTITSMMWEHLKSGWLGVPEELIRQVKMDCDRQVALENRGYRSATWRTLRALQKVQGAKEIWGCTCVTAPPFFSKTGPTAVRNSDTTATGQCGNTDEPVVIVWDGLNEEERESAMHWMSTAKPWVLWKQRDSLSTIKKSENTVEGQLQSLLEERGWSLTGKGGKTKQGSKKNRRKTNTGTDGASESGYGEETQNEGWTGGSVRQKNWWRSGQVKLAQSRVTMECWISGWTAPNQEVVDVVREAWMCESGKDECARASAGPETAYWRGTEFSRMGGYNFPGQIAASDGSEGNGSMGAGFIVLKNPKATGSIRVGRTEEGTDSTRAEMAALLEVLIGADVNENLVVMVDNQSILREISRWVGEGGRTFLALSANPDILRMIIGRLRMRIAQGTATVLCKVKSHRGEPLNEAADDLADLGRTIDPEHAVWTTRSNRMVFSWIDGQKKARTSTWNQGVRNGVRLGAGRYRFEARLQQGVRNWLQGWGGLPSGVGRVISRAEVLRMGRWLNPKGWARGVMEKLRGAPHSEPLTDTWTSDFLSREGEGREVIGERLRDRTVPWQAQRRLMQAVTNSFPCGAHLHRMGLRGSSGCTLCQRARKQRVDDQQDGCGRIDPETLGHIQSARCALQARAATSAHHHCWQQVQREIAVASPESKGWNFLTLEGEQSMQSFWKKTCRELYRQTTLTAAQAQEMTDEELEGTMWEAARPWEEQWEALQADESKVEGQVIDEDDRQARFWRRRPDGFAVNEKEHVIYVLEFKRVADNGEKYVSETQKLAETQHLAITQGLKRLFKDTQWTVEQLSFVAGHKSVSASAWHDLLSKFGISKEDRMKVIKNLGRTLLDELENLFRSYWAHRLGVSDGLLQVLGHNVRVKTQEVQSYQPPAPE